MARTKDATRLIANRIETCAIMAGDPSPLPYVVRMRWAAEGYALYDAGAKALRDDRAATVAFTYCARVIHALRNNPDCQASGDAGVGRFYPAALDTPAVTDQPEKVAKVAHELFQALDADQEHLMVLALDARMAITGYKVVASGGMSHCDADPKVVFRTALLLGASSIILVHNHPTGDPTPSEDDRRLTERSTSIGRDLTLPVLDHLVLGEGGSWFSIVRGCGGRS